MGSFGEQKHVGKVLVGPPVIPGSVVNRAGGRFSSKGPHWTCDLYHVEVVVWPWLKGGVPSSDPLAASSRMRHPNWICILSCSASFVPAPDSPEAIFAAIAWVIGCVFLEAPGLVLVGAGLRFFNGPHLQASVIANNCMGGRAPS